MYLKSCPSAVECHSAAIPSSSTPSSYPHTPAAVPLALATSRTTNAPAPTVTLPVAVQAAPDSAEHVNAVSAILPGVPMRTVTVMVFDCREKALNCVAAHPAGTHVSTESA